MRSFKITQSITNKDDLSVKLFLKDINKIPLISREREIELSKLIRQGNQKALEELVSSNLRFVVSVAKQFRNQGLPFIDLINEGALGMITAAKKFDGSKGYKFISYAVWWIRQSIMQALALKSKTIKLPINQSNKISKLNKISEQFEQLNGRYPSNEELAIMTGLTLDKISEIYSYNTNCVSIDTPFTTEEDSGSLVDVLENPNSDRTDKELLDTSVKDETMIVLDKLTPRYKVILQMIFGINCEPLQLEQIAPKFGVTAERIRQMRDAALKELKDNYSKQLKNIL